MKSAITGDFDAAASMVAADGTFTVIDAFGEHIIIQGKEAILEAWEGMIRRRSNQRVLKNEILSAGEEKGIGNIVLRWKGSDGKEWACNHIFTVSLDENDRCVFYTEWNVVEAREK